MTDSKTKYYLDESLKDLDNDKWEYLLDFAFDRADQIEFNILNSNKDLACLKTELSDDFVETGNRKDKIYSSGKFIRYRLSDDMKQFVKSKNYRDWYNFVFEDISFLKDGLEFFATITHENYVILQLTTEQKDTFNKKGFDFLYEWPDKSWKRKIEYLIVIGKSQPDKLNEHFNTTTH